MTNGTGNIVFHSRDVRWHREWSFFMHLAYMIHFNISSHLRDKDIGEIQDRYTYIGYTTSLPVIDSTQNLNDDLAVVDFRYFVNRMWQIYSAAYEENAATYESLCLRPKNKEETNE